MCPLPLPILRVQLGGLVPKLSECKDLVSQSVGYSCVSSRGYDSNHAAPAVLRLPIAKFLVGVAAYRQAASGEGEARLEMIQAAERGKPTSEIAQLSIERPTSPYRPLPAIRDVGGEVAEVHRRCGTYKRMLPDRLGSLTEVQAPQSIPWIFSATNWSIERFCIPRDRKSAINCGVTPWILMAISWSGSGCR